MAETGPFTSSDEAYVFDLANAVRLWLAEKVKRGEITARDAEDAVRKLDAKTVREKTEDFIKDALGPLKDSWGSITVARKMASDFGQFWRARVYFKSTAKGDYVIVRGWPTGRKVLSGTRYRLDNPKIMELQIGKPGIRAAAKESARFGIYLIVAVDLVEFARSHDFPQLLASLTIDIPSALVATALGAMAAEALSGVAVVAAVAMGPALIGLGVAIFVGAGLYWLDQHFKLTEKVKEVYARGLEKLQRWWEGMGSEARAKWEQFRTSRTIRYLHRKVEIVLSSVGRVLNSDDGAGLRSLIR